MAYVTKCNDAITNYVTARYFDWSSKSLVLQIVYNQPHLLRMHLHGIYNVVLTVSLRPKDEYVSSQSSTACLIIKSIYGIEETECEGK